MSAQPIEPNHPNTYAITSDNRLAVQTVIDNLALPAPTLVARPDAVHITLADVDDLGQWMYALGGEIRRGIEIAGASLWTLHTETPVRLNGGRVRILVHVPVVSGEDVLAELRTAVTDETVSHESKSSTCPDCLAPKPLTGSQTWHRIGCPQRESR
uniref:hypothetical protein n=1 Tax=Streptomyces sp. NBC_01177 TaxID=2903761 RepID=UPI002F913294|nr:hypothetical protein OG284_36795 [Streptomyces sp. NBC_01177]